ncbi:MAG TPA: hypothetical protein VH877_04565 [Polyangia bacterium]|nr:hypothetical protein [Polyangia bacterium]
MAQGTGGGKYDSDPIDVVALARGLVPDTAPPPPVVTSAQLGQVLKPKPPPLPLWIRILMASAVIAVCGVVGTRFYRGWKERKAAEAAAIAAAEAKAAKEARERAAAEKAAREAKEAAERAEAEKQAAAERAKAAAAEQAAAAEANAAAAAAKGHHHSDRSSSSRSKGGSETASAAPASNEPLPATLTRNDILKGMQGIQPQISSCFAQYHVPGTALVSITIAPSGRVQKAVVAGPLAGTPTGDCVAKAVRGASFSAFASKALSVQYPIMLR